MWGDSPGRATVEAVVEERADVLQQIIRRQIAAGKPPEFVSLALSGGGSDGAFGAGLLGGWTLRGDRPEFHLVTGISTGAIIAVFAFLGPEYDDDLHRMYTSYETSDLFTRTIFAALTGGSAVLDASGYRSLLEQYIDDAVVAGLAEAYREGRVLLIGTTNIDASRPVIWNIGAIAASGAPHSKKLIHDVIQASSAIPAAFPPVLIPVEANGRMYDEMHVDGGATQQVMLYSPGIPTRQIDKAIGTRVGRKAYVIINNKLDKGYDPVHPRLVPMSPSLTRTLEKKR
jgi:predicted acylesterase/phospholipase RssA